jgi:hypothetical protein
MFPEENRVCQLLETRGRYPQLQGNESQPVAACHGVLTRTHKVDDVVAGDLYRAQHSSIECP